MEMSAPVQEDLTGRPAPGTSTPVNHSNQARQTERALGVVLVLGTLLIYSPLLGCSFLAWGDSDYVTENRNVQAGLKAGTVRWAFTTLETGNWHPLTWLSLLLDTSIYGSDSAAGFHFTNVLLHALSTLVLFLFLSRATGAVWRSAMVAALFAVHPMQVEAVAWVGERKGVLSTLFWMLTLAAYLAYVRRRGFGRYLLVVLTFVLGLMAKPMLVTLPFVLLLLDYWPLNRWGRSHAADASALPSVPSSPESLPLLVLEKVPFVLIALTWSVLTYVAEKQIGALPTLGRFPLDVRIWNALLAYANYMGKMFFPVGLAAYYPHPGRTVAVGPALGAGLLLAVITVLVLGPGRRRRYLAVGWLWYLGTLVPVIGLVQVLSYRMADRYSYVPLIGLFLMLTWAVSDWAAARGWPRSALISITGVALGICVVRTWVQLGYWENDRELWEHAAVVTERNGMAHNFLGIDYARRGQVNSAEEEFRKAVEFDPEEHRFHYNLATQLRELARNEEAVVECRQAVALLPAAARYHFLLGDLLRDVGREDEALAEYQEAIRLDPTSAVGHNSLANLLLDLGRRSEAVAEYHKALELQPGYPAPHVGLGNDLASLGRREEAVTEFRRAIDLDPRRPVPHVNLGRALQELGRLDEAMDAYGRALNLGYRPAADHLRTCDMLRGLLPRLPDVVAERERPETNPDRLAFATLCRQPFVGRYVLATRLYSAALTADPGLGDDVRTGVRYDAAVVAAQAGCGQGQDAAGLDSRAKAQLREQARTWLQTDLNDWAKLLQRNSPADRAAVRRALRVWQRDIGLEGVREGAPLIQLPEIEREAWQKFWHDVREIRARASPGV